MWAVLLFVASFIRTSVCMCVYDHCIDKPYSSDKPVSPSVSRNAVEITLQKMCSSHVNFTSDQYAIRTVGGVLGSWR
jgi:hypothetical protein